MMRMGMFDAPYTRLNVELGRVAMQEFVRTVFLDQEFGKSLLHVAENPKSVLSMFRPYGCDIPTHFLVLSRSDREDVIWFTAKTKFPHLPIIHMVYKDD